MNSTQTGIFQPEAPGGGMLQIQGSLRTCPGTSQLSREMVGENSRFPSSFGDLENFISVSHWEQILDMKGSFLLDLKNREPAPHSFVVLGCASIRRDPGAEFLGQKWPRNSSQRLKFLDNFPRVLLQAFQREPCQSMDPLGFPIQLPEAAIGGPKTEELFNSSFSLGFGMISTCAGT